MDQKSLPTVNGVPVSLVGHGHIITDISDFAHTHLVSEIRDTIALRAKRGTSAQAISANTATKVQFNVEDYDYGDCFDTTLFRFTPPANQSVGVYRVICGIYLSGTSIGRIMLYKNGVEHTRLDERSQTNIQFNGMTEVLLTTSDYLEIYIYLNSARSIAVNNSYLNISSVF